MRVQNTSVENVKSSAINRVIVLVIGSKRIMNNSNFVEYVEELLSTVNNKKNKKWCLDSRCTADKSLFKSSEKMQRNLKLAN